MVDCNVNIIYISNDTNNQTISDLYWYDIDNNMTFNTFECIYSMYNISSLNKSKREYVADLFINNYFDYIISGNLSNKWGGYMFITSIDIIEFIMTYPGKYNDALNNILPLMNYIKSAQLMCNLVKYNTYYGLCNKIWWKYNKC